MSPEEFANRAVGVPWVKWRADWDGMDCFGLVVMFFGRVLGVDLGAVPQTSIAEGFSQAQGWTECGPGDEAGAGVASTITAWMAWHAGAPTPCGVVLPGGLLLHADGTESRPGNVRVSRLDAMRRLCGDIRFYRYTAPPLPC
jgi:hypothetical protein